MHTKLKLADVLATNQDLFHPCFTGFGCEEGWAQIIAEMRVQWRRLELPCITVVKEKLGLLRITCEDRTDTKATALAREFEKRSAGICDQCGAVGQLRTFHGYVATRFEGCYLK